MTTKNQNLDEIMEKVREARREFMSKCPLVVFPKSTKELTVSTVLGPNSTFAEYEGTRSPTDEEIEKLRENYQKAEARSSPKKTNYNS